MMGIGNFGKNNGNEGTREKKQGTRKVLSKVENVNTEWNVYLSFGRLMYLPSTLMFFFHSINDPFVRGLT
jgi:hypothetical protein